MNIGEAITDIQENFDTDKIISCDDQFDGACLDSEEIEYTVLNE